MELENNTAEQQTPAPEAPKSNLVSMIVIGLLAVVAFVFIMFKSGALDGNDACVIVPQSAFGQSEQQVWTELTSPETSKAVAGFYLSVPEVPVEYETLSYRVYTKQISEMRYINSSMTEVLRVSKGLMCGADIYDVNMQYPCRNVVTVGDLEVTEYGSTLDSVALASWVNGEFSYFVGAFAGEISKDEMEALILSIE